jgi:hypothetical protein
MSLEFFNPQGEEIKDANLSEVVQLLQNQGESYWSVGSGAAELTFSEGGCTTKLQLVFHRNCGFHLLFVSPDRARFLSTGDGPLNHVVKPYVGGDPMPLPEAYFVTRETAVAAVEEFGKSGQQPSNVRWIKDEDAIWSRDPDWYERHHG